MIHYSVLLLQGGSAEIIVAPAAPANAISSVTENTKQDPIATPTTATSTPVTAPSSNVNAGTPQAMRWGPPDPAVGNNHNAWIPEDHRDPHDPRDPRDPHDPRDPRDPRDPWDPPTESPPENGIHRIESLTLTDFEIPPHQGLRISINQVVFSC